MERKKRCKSKKQMKNQPNSRSQRRKSSNKESRNSNKFCQKSRWIRAIGVADRRFTGNQIRSGLGVQWEGKSGSKENQIGVIIHQSFKKLCFVIKLRMRALADGKHRK